ncbi:hypothetical protein H8957_002406, partial [Semnopithecus entellus]
MTCVVSQPQSSVCGPSSDVLSGPARSGRGGPLALGDGHAFFTQAQPPSSCLWYTWPLSPPHPTTCTMGPSGTVPSVAG